MHEIDLSKYRIRTDLIVEHLSNIKDYKRYEEVYDDIKIETIELDKDRAKIIDKKEGIYKTIYFDDVTDENNFAKLLDVTIKALKDLLKSINIKNSDSVLIVGLGNRKATPDALGPLTIDSIKITRQIVELGLPLDKKYRVISSIVPGVMGTTGIETKEIIEGVIEKVKPNFLIVIDALAASSLERINKTIQLTDTGIHPGSGLLNNRFEISKEALGLPVIAIGIPTVVETAVLVNDCLDLFIEKLQDEAKSNDYLNKLKEEDNYEEIKQALLPKDYNLIVTPKEIDDLIENMKDIVARGINFAVN